MEHAPTLRNYIERQTYRIDAAPPDYEAQLTDSKLGDPVLVVAADFEASWPPDSPPRWRWCRQRQPARGRAVGRLTATAARLQPGAGHLRLALRGVAPAALEVVHVQERDLANPPRARRSFTVHAAVLRADGGAVRRAERGAGHHRRRARARVAGAAADEPGTSRQCRWCWANGARWPRWAC
jgi:sodium transport system permease protein